MKYSILTFLLTFILGACSFNSVDRRPSSFKRMSNNSKVSLNISLADFQLGFKEATKNSKIIKSINHFYMDPVTRIFNLNLTVNYPLEKLIDYSALPATARPSDYHDIEIGFKFERAKNLYKSRYIGLQFTKFKIDGDDYINQFEFVLSGLKTLLANSELVNYLLIKNKDSFPSEDYYNLVTQAFENNTIITFPETKKIKLKLDLTMFSDFVSFTKKFEDINVWKLEPIIYKEDNISSYDENNISNEDVALNITLGIGKPSDSYINTQQDVIKSDQRTLTEVRSDFYETYSNPKLIADVSNQYLKSLLYGEKGLFYNFLYGHIQYDQNTKFGKTLSPLKKKYNTAVSEMLKSLSKHGEEKLSLSNQHFKAAPEYEYENFLIYMKNRLRNEVNNLRRAFEAEYAILKGGNHNNLAKPIFIKKVSQNLINASLLSLMDLQVDGVNMIKDPSAWLKPDSSEIIFKGKINLPLSYILSKVNTDFKIDESKYNLIEKPIPFEITIHFEMEDNGKLALDLKSLEFITNSKKTLLTRSSRNQRFMFDFFKLFLANTLASVEIDFEEDIPEEERKRNEIQEVLTYIGLVKKAYGSKKNLEEMIKSDIKINPFNAAGTEIIQRKKKILLKDVVKFRDDQKLELNLDPALVIEKIANVKHGLQVWDMRALMSSALNNTFLELSIGKGKRSNDFILDQYALRGSLDNSDFRGVTYGLQDKNTSSDLIFSLNAEYLENYINSFLKEMIATEKQTLEEKATSKKGETFFQVNELSFKILKGNRLNLTASIQRGKFGRSFTHISSWLRGKYIEDEHRFQFLINLKSKNYLQKSTKLIDLTYYPQAISVVPLQARVLPGYNAGVIGKAIVKFTNVAIKIALKSAGLKKLLLRLVDNFLGKMYTENKGKIIGHEIEKIARLHTTSKELLIFLNPKLASNSYNVHLAGDEDPVSTAIKIDYEKQVVHFALTAGVNMIKTHKKNLFEIYTHMEEYLEDFRKASSKAELKKLLLKGRDFAEKLVLDDNNGRTGFFRKYIKTMANYDQVMNITKLRNHLILDSNGQGRSTKEGGLYIELDSKDLDISLKSQISRISATGAELMYFAAISKYLNQRYTEVKKKMETFGLNSTHYGYDIIKQAQAVVNKPITKALLNKYEKTHLNRNQIILKNKPSYWTYQNYPDAYFADRIYKIIK